MYRVELGTHAASVDVIVKIAQALDVPPGSLDGGRGAVDQYQPVR